MCMKKFNKWMGKNIKKLNWLDIGFIKWASAAFALMIAKLWPGILGLNWYWYMIIAIVLAIRPIYKAYIK